MSNSVRNVKPIIKTIKKNEKISIVLLYPGDNSKLKNGPRPLLEINNKYLFEHQLRAIEDRFSIIDHEIIAITGFESEKVMNKLPKHIIKIENERYYENNVCRSLGMALRATDASNILFIYGDLWFNKYTLEFDLDKSGVVVDISDKYMNGQIGCTSSNNELDIMMYGLTPKWAEIAFCTGKELQLLKNICWNSSKHNLFGFEIINEIVSKGGRFSIRSNSNMKMCDIDSSKDLTKVKELVL